MAKRVRARDEFISGLTMTIVFGALWLVFGSKFWILPMVFAGLIPSIRGGVRFFTDRSLPRRKARQIPGKTTSSIEREILAVARNERGTVTPAIVALNSDVSMEEAQKALEDMVRRGYASMEVKESGTVEYVFPEFLP